MRGRVFLPENSPCARRRHSGRRQAAGLETGVPNGRGRDVAAELFVKFDVAALDEAAHLLSLSACALGASNVTLAKSQNYLVKPALLAEAPSRKIAITQVTDARDAATRDRTGDKRNMYGKVMGTIVTTEPVTDTVRKVIAETFTANKHTVVADPSATTLKVEAVVTKFWFDYKTGLTDVEFLADVQTRLSVKETSGTEIFAKDFKGYLNPPTPPCADPHARWCGRGSCEAPPYPDFGRDAGRGAIRSPRVSSHSR